MRRERGRVKIYRKDCSKERNDISLMMAQNCICKKWISISQCNECVSSFTYNMQLYTAHWRVQIRSHRQENLSFMPFRKEKRFLSLNWPVHVKLWINAANWSENDSRLKKGGSIGKRSFKSRMGDVKDAPNLLCYQQSHPQYLMLAAQKLLSRLLCTMSDARTALIRVYF